MWPLFSICPLGSLLNGLIRYVKICLLMCVLNIVQDSSISQQLKSLSPNLLDFLKTAHNHDPELFSNEATYSAQDTSQLLEELTTVRLAWSRLKDMRQSGQKWSEADYAANVYNMFRSPAMNRSTYRYSDKRCRLLIES